MMKNKILKNFGTYFCLTILLETILYYLIDMNNTLVFTISFLIKTLIVIICIYFINKKQINKMFKEFKTSYKKYFIKNLFTWIIGFILMMITNHIIFNIILDTPPVNETLIRELYDNFLIYSIINNCLMIPVLEEWVFRLGFDDIKNKYLYLLSSGLVFALLHVLGSINSLLSVIYILPYLILGICFGIIYLRSKNIFDSVIIHAIHNIIVLVVYIFL